MNKSPSSQWLPFVRPNPQANIRLFCFPYAGGGASVFRTWATDMSSRIEVCSVQLPARENRLAQAPFTDMDTLTDELLYALSPYLDQPFAFFGYSLGGVVAFELARRLRRAGMARPLHLFVGACPSPRVPYHDPGIYLLPDAELMQKLRELKGTPEPVLQHPELMQLLLPTLRADFQLYATYTYEEEDLLEIPITAFGGMSDEVVDHSALQRWRAETQHTFALHMLPGDHFFLHQERSTMAKIMLQQLTGG